MSQEIFNPKYIAVEGVIGVGKTTFSKMLAECLEAELLQEEVFENPFLVDFYKNPKRFAFSCQMFFLISRFQQQQQPRSLVLQSKLQPSPLRLYRMNRKGVTQLMGADVVQLTALRVNQPGESCF